MPNEDTSRVNVEIAHDEAGPVPAPISVKLFLQPLAAPTGACAKVRQSDVNQQQFAAGAPVSTACLQHPAGRFLFSTNSPVTPTPPPQPTPVDAFTVPAGARAGKLEWTLPIDKLMALKPGCTRDSCYLRIEAREERGGRKAEGSSAAARRGKGLLGVAEGEAQVRRRLPGF